MAQGKVIISCAITGAMHTPTMSDALPITPRTTIAIWVTRRTSASPAVGR